MKIIKLLLWLIVAVFAVVGFIVVVGATVVGFTVVIASAILKWNDFFIN